MMIKWTAERDGAYCTGAFAVRDVENTLGDRNKTFTPISTCLVSVLFALGLMLTAVQPARANYMHATAEWDAFKRTYMSADGRVSDPENGWISHSEGQGWSMLLAVANNDPEAFERLWLWTRRNLQRSNDALFSWRYDPSSRPHVTENMHREINHKR